MGYELVVEKRSKGSEEVDEFCVNIHGMQFVRTTALEHGMLCKDYERPDFPAGSRSSSEGQQAAENVRKWRPANMQGIPAHKLMSNDQWHVSPDECREALALYTRAQKRGSVEDDLFAEFVAFLKHAATRGGFRVW